MYEEETSDWNIYWKVHWMVIFKLNAQFKSTENYPAPG